MTRPVKVPGYRHASRGSRRLAFIAGTVQGAKVTTVTATRTRPTVT